MKDYSRTLAATAAEPTAARQTKYFMLNIDQVKTPDDLINNSNLYAYVMKAFGLSDMAYAKALIRKVLTGGISDPKSIANTLNDSRYRALAATFNFALKGSDTTSSPELQQTTVSRYVEQTLESNAGEQNPGTQMALYFQRMAPHITSAHAILGDKKLLSVVQTALGLPRSMSLEKIDVQARMITSQMRISDLHDPVKLRRFIERFTAVYDSQNPIAAPTRPQSALLVNSPRIDSDLLLSLAKLRLGGS
jgi:hypothetical protein